METKFDKLVAAIQFILLGIFTVFSLSVVLWVSHLLNIAVRLDDSPSASVGISIVAIPLFLLLLGIVHYVFWGLRRGRKER